MKRILILVGIALAVPQAALAVLTFEQLDANTFSVSHQVKGFGGRGQAMELVYEKAASLCVAAGYKYMEVIGQESHAGGAWQSPNATVTIKFFSEGGGERIGCELKASDEYVIQATKKLASRGYSGPVEAETPTEVTVRNDGEVNHCTVAQITAMVNAGLSENQIKAACAVAD